MLRKSTAIRLRQLLLRSHQKSSGFTLIEILVSLLMAGIVMTGLMYLVVELLRVDRRELGLEQVQRDMQRAMDYVSDDLREAVYVYPDPSTVAAQLTDLPAGTPVLAFWRPDFVDEANIPANATCSTTYSGNIGACSALAARRATYTLVVYVQSPTSGVWEGESRLVRYALEQYPNSDPITSNFAERTGYVDPISTGVGSVAEGTANFEAWTRDGSTTDGVSSVLVDFVDTPDFDATNAADCSSNDFTGNAAYTVSPSTATTTSSFIACVRDPNPTALSSGTVPDGRSGQDVFLFLRGDINQEFMQPASEESRLPSLQSRILVRGVLDKEQVDD